MTTATAEQELRLPWDYFLNQDPNEKVHRPHVEAFRRNEWPAVRRYLREEYQWDIPETLEPHWVTSGKAVYWQPQINRHVGIIKDEFGEDAVDEEGTPILGFVEDVTGWVATGGLPANNPSIVAHYLNKGFRFRPPSSSDLAVEVKDVEALQEAAASQEEAKAKRDEEQRQQVTYTCLRHRTGKMAFRSWKAYIRHCASYKEQPTEQPPPSIVTRMAGYKYYCFLHDRGYDSERMANRHITIELRRGGRGNHPALAHMAVSQDKKDSSS
jgi:hypothetical protein